eukprot:TRINITY_DN12660_c0_g1_i1.p1 TRINITY_DN12660_c0_g1~~TRINITY_DN12660_c0_g1_i1.p1  ORF type:complete len:112 (-),score=27.81 TRINITY_DN12660_c0_g1_i1:14-349(-)
MQCAVVGKEGHYIFNARIRKKLPEDESDSPVRTPEPSPTPKKEISSPVLEFAPPELPERAEIPRASTPEDNGSGARLAAAVQRVKARYSGCLLYTSPSPRDRTRSRMPSSA